MSKLTPPQKRGKRENVPLTDKRKQEKWKPGVSAEDPSFLVCDIDPYPQVEPGEYELYCDEVKVYLDPGLKSWKCRYRFRDLTREDFPAVFGFLNLGKENRRPGPRSRYYQEWAIANGSAPAKRQRMTSRTFRGKFFRVWIDWVLKRRYDGTDHTTETRYSLVKGLRGLACFASAELPSIEVQKPLSKVGFIEEEHSKRLDG